jgi:large subunit ribosomal protein L25
MHAWKQNVLHVDFQRVDPSKKIHMKVPLHFVNAEISPGVKLSSGIVSHIINELEIACLPKDLPEFIEVDLKDLAAGHSIHLSNLNLPAGVESVALNRKDDQSVATIIIPRAVAADEAAAATVSAADVPAANQKAKEEAPKKDDKAKK